MHRGDRMNVNATVLHCVRRAILTWLLLGVSTAHAANVNVRVDRTRLYDNESLHLTIEHPGTQAVQLDTTPLLKDFDLIDSMQSSQMQIVNGKSSARHSWIITLAPKHAGELTIPALQVGSDSTTPITLNVHKADPKQQARTQDVFVELSTESLTPLVQSQVVVTIKLWHAVPVREIALSRLDGPDMLIERLGDDTTYIAQREKRQFEVLERRYAIFPQRSGPLTLPGVRFTGKVPDKRMRRSEMPNNDDFGDPFGLLQALVAVRGKSSDVVLDVQPRQMNQTHATWLPATKLQLRETWPSEPSSITVGVPFARTITLQVDGLTAAQIPALTLPDADGMKVYAETPRPKQQSNADGIQTTVDYAFTVVAARPGELIMPSIDIPWWSTTTNSAQLARLPDRHVAVIGEASAAVATTATPDTDASANGATAATSDAIVAAPANTAELRWSLAGVLAVGAIGAVMWRRQRDKLATPMLQLRQRSAVDKLRRRFADACTRSNAPAARDALLAYAAALKQDSPPRTLAALADTLPAAAQNAVLTLDQALYSNQSGTWRGEDLLAAADAIKLGDEKITQDRKMVLTELYPPTPPVGKK